MVANSRLSQDCLESAKKGRWRVRFPQGGNFEPPTQNIGARISGGVLGKNKSGLDFDEYQLPTGEFLYPELWCQAILRLATTSATSSTWSTAQVRCP